MDINWKNSILDIMNDISDEKYQREAWFGLNKDIVDSPEEMYCTLFDDYDFEIFLTIYKDELSDKQKQLGKEIMIKMNSINDLNYKYLIDNKDWNNVRILAKHFLRTFSQ